MRQRMAQCRWRGRRGTDYRVGPSDCRKLRSGSTRNTTGPGNHKRCQLLRPHTVPSGYTRSGNPTHPLLLGPRRPGRQARPRRGLLAGRPGPGARPAAAAAGPPQAPPARRGVVELGQRARHACSSSSSSTQHLRRKAADSWQGCSLASHTGAGAAPGPLLLSCTSFHNPTQPQPHPKEGGGGAALAPPHP